MGRILTGLLGIGAALAVGGCSLFHHRGVPPQQQFLTALQRGDSIQANRIWLNMTAQDRANLSHSIGIKPQVSAADIQAQIMRHAQQKAAQEGGESGEEMADPDRPVIDTGDINTEMIDMPALDTDPAGELQNLPNLVPEGNQAPPDSVPEIQQIQ